MEALKEQMKSRKAAFSGCNTTMKLGDQWYLISKKWGDAFRRAYRAAERDEEEVVDPGPVDNKDLVDVRGNLLPQMGENFYELITKEQWNMILSWYPQSGPAISRNVIKFLRGSYEQIVVEVYQIQITADTPCGTVSFPVSKALTVAQLTDRICKSVNPPLDQDRVRVFALEDGRRSELLLDSHAQVGSIFFSETGMIEVEEDEPEDLENVERNKSGDSMSTEFENTASRCPSDGEVGVGVGRQQSGGSASSGAARRSGSSNNNNNRLGGGNNDEEDDNEYSSSDDDNNAYMSLPAQVRQAQQAAGGGGAGGGGYSNVGTSQYDDDGDDDYDAGVGGGAGGVGGGLVRRVNASGGASISSAVEMSTMNRNKKNFGNDSDSDTDEDMSSNRRTTTTTTTNFYRSNNNYGGGGGGYYDRPTVPPGPLQVLPGGGLKGLQNLGNTCFMNSGLQCLSNSEPLIEFMLSGKYEEDLNPDNPLGMGGKLAQAFTQLMRMIWGLPKQVSSVNPSELKSLIGRFAFQFTGYSQHDSQELLAFLLDGIHEDLNRVRRKQQTEQVVGNGNNDQRDAAEAWYRHLLRNRSVVVDHFQGQYRSELHCPECQQVSTNFDPYMYLTLQLPEERSSYRSAVFVPCDPNRRHLKIGVSVGKHSTILETKQAVGEQLGVNPKRLIIGDVWQGRFYRWLKDREKFDAIGQSDDTFIYELEEDVTPANVPTFTYQGMSPYSSLITPVDAPDPDTPRFAHIVVLHRRVERYMYQSDWRSFSVPQIITLPLHVQLTVKEVKDRLENLITRYVLPRKAKESVQQDGDAQPDADTPQKRNGEEEFADASSDTSDDTPPPSRQEEMMDDGEPPYEFKIVSDSVASGGRPIGNDDDVIDLSRVPAFVVDWSQRGLSRYNDKGIFNDREIDKSVRGKKTGDDRAATGGVDLTTCLDAFVEPETLGVNDKWRCPHCKIDVQARKRMNLWSTPELLVIHLKRFSSDDYYREKLDTLVTFPLTDLDMSRYLQRAGGPLLYDLYAVSNHFGSPAFGHYTAYAKPPRMDEWYEFNDSSVSRVDAQTVVSAGAYLLFYRRRSEPTPESLSCIPDGVELTPSGPLADRAAGGGGGARATTTTSSSSSSAAAAVSDRAEAIMMEARRRNDSEDEEMADGYRGATTPSPTKYGSHFDGGANGDDGL